jgi:hypothetical protein
MPGITGIGFCRGNSKEGRQALARLGMSSPAGPVVALYNGMVLVHPGNADVAEALGSTCGQPDRPRT